MGIATQVEHLRDRLEVDEAARRLENFLRGTTALLVDYARVCGRSSLSDIGPDDLASLDAELARASGLEWIL